MENIHTIHFSVFPFNRNHISHISGDFIVSSFPLFIDHPSKRFLQFSIHTSIYQEIENAIFKRNKKCRRQINKDSSFIVVVKKNDILAVIYFCCDFCRVQNLKNFKTYQELCRIFGKLFAENCDCIDFQSLQQGCDFF